MHKRKLSNLNTNVKDQLISLFEQWSKEKIINYTPLPISGSDRRYFRISGKTKSAIGVSNSDIKENTAFLSFTKHFLAKGLPMPELYGENAKKNIYLLQDLGDETLFSFLTKKRKTDGFSEELVSVYKKVIEVLPKFQLEGGKDLDYSVCYPRKNFDKQSMLWDLHYFKYYFLKLAKIPFDEQALEDDFNKFSDFLIQTDCNYFLYRDFQSRNIMLYDDEPFFIDYQGGRKGALQYDLASLLYDAKADIPPEIRNQLLDYYINVISQYKEINQEEFKTFFRGYVLIRILQALGAYGFRGFYEKKEHFLLSIPFALKNLSELLKTIALPIDIPVLLDVIHRITLSEELNFISKHNDKLKVTIYSFSYKKGLPSDFSGNGGGFVFDCRALHNPGRYDEYKQLTGKDQPVIDFLFKEIEVSTFLNNVFSLVEQSVDLYLKRNFTNLMVSFGCTGGQHRSVYCAEALAKYLKNKYNILVELIHREQTEKLNNE